MKSLLPKAAILTSLPSATAFSLVALSSDQCKTCLHATRRSFISKYATSALTAPLVISPKICNAASVPVQRAVGSAESQCRREGNCLETFEVSNVISVFFIKHLGCRISRAMHLSWMEQSVGIGVVQNDAMQEMPIGKTNLCSNQFVVM